MTTYPAEPGGVYCHAEDDGSCSWPHCPQSCPPTCDCPLLTGPHYQPLDFKGFSHEQIVAGLTVPACGEGKTQ